MESRERIRRAGRRLRKACTAMIWALPFVAALFWLGLNYFPEFSREALRDQLPIKIQGQLPFRHLVLGYLVNMVQMGVVIYGLINLRRLFRLYEQGLIFESENVLCLRQVGKAIIVWAVAETFVNSVLGIVLTLHNPPGQRLLQVGVSSAQALLLFGGFMVLTIAWVMDEGRKIQAEHSLIV